MKKYIINWSCNNGTNGEFTSNNLRESIKDVNDILKGETFIGNDYHYCIYLSSEISEEGIYGMPVKERFGYKSENGNLC